MDIKIIINIQRFFREKIVIKKRINKILDFNYEQICSLMKRIETNYKNELINEYNYNNSMDKLEQIFENLKIYPRPMMIKDCLNLDIKTFEIQIKKIRHDLLILVENNGHESINKIIELYYNQQLTDMFDQKNSLIIFMNNFFIPTSLNIYNNSDIEEYLLNLKEDNRFSNIKNNNQIIEFKPNKKTNSINDYYHYDIQTIRKIIHPICRPLIKKRITLLEHIQGTRLYIPCKKTNTYIIMNGYFLEDPLNISQFGNYLGKKRKELYKNIQKLDIDDKFKEGYLKQLSLRDFILYNNQEIIDNCNNAYNEVIYISQKDISNIIKDFMDSDIERQRYIITIFILMNNNINLQYIAYFLYDLITSENYSSKNQNKSDIIYNSLHWSVKRLFKGFSQKITSYNQQLIDYNIGDLSYEKRINLMKAPETIKAKAMEKFQEMNSRSSNEDMTKTKQYLDGLLKIPFGLYRKEKIISFLSEFRGEIIRFINLAHEIFKQYQDTNSQNYNSYLNNICLLLNESLSNKMNSTDISKFIENFDIQTQQLLANQIKSFEELNNDELVEEVIKISTYMRIQEIKNIVKEINRQIEIDLDPLEKIIYKGNKYQIIENLKIFFQTIDQEYQEKYFQKLSSYGQHHFMTFDTEVSKIVNKFQHLKNKWINYQNDYKKYFIDVDQTLDNSIYGQHEAKTQIKRVLAQWINGESSGYCFGFEGAPGVGKTSLAKKGISKCLLDIDGSYRPFCFVALGGTSNGSFLEGHGYTYVKSTWGKIVDILMDSKCMNPIIYIDELDKVSGTENGKEIIGILTHITDSTQNEEFTDKYFGSIKIDLSKVLFIFSYNDYNLLDPILADRIHRVKFTNIDINDKIKVVNNYLLKELCSTVGFNQNDISIEDEVIKFIITNYTYEAGVRKLKEKLFEIIREINLRYLLNRNKFSLPVKITVDLVEEVFSGKPKISIKKIADRPYVGRVNGLFATSSGVGGLTIIEAYKTPSDSHLQLILTGQQGDVMKESMSVAKTVSWYILPKDIRSRIEKLTNIDGKFGIHIHCPEASTPKDGPSAGGAITVAIISLLTGIPIKNTIAITGEIHLSGEIHKIGGLEHKIEGAKNAGVKLVLCPEENTEDLRIIREKEKSPISGDFEVKTVKNIWEILDIVLVENNLEFGLLNDI